MRLFQTKKGTRDLAGIPFVSNMMPKAGFEPAFVRLPGILDTNWTLGNAAGRDLWFEE